MKSKTFSLLLITFLSTVFAGLSQIDSSRVRQLDSLLEVGDFQRRNSTEQAINTFNSVLELSIQSSDSIYSARALDGLGESYAAQQDFAKSLEFHYEALNYLSPDKHFMMHASVNNNIGVLYGRFNLYDDALDYYLEAERYVNLSDDRYKYNLYNLLLMNISILEGRRGNHAESMRYALEAEKAIQQVEGLSNDIKNFRAAVTINEKARAFMELGRVDSAFYYIRRSYPIANKSNSAFVKGKANYYLGKILMEMGNFSDALKYARDADLVAYSIDDLATRKEIYLLISSLYEEGNDSKRALSYYKKANNVTEEISDVKNTWMLYKMRREIRTKEEEQQLVLWEQEEEQRLALLEKDRKFGNTLRLLYTVLAGVIVLFGFFYIKNLRARYRKEKEQYEKLQELTELELQKTKEVLEINKKELTSAALQIIENGETVQQFRKEIETFKQSIDSAHHKKLETLASSITNSSRKNWEEFRSRFEQVNTDFFKNLKEQHPELSSNELKICSFLKLNFNSKDIASLMGISPESVKVSRYRLRKKLGLDRSENLTNYVDQF